jgi:branched-chain amino acid transport system substrate-binding protein
MLMLALLASYPATVGTRAGAEQNGSQGNRERGSRHLAEDGWGTVIVPPGEPVEIAIAAWTDHSIGQEQVLSAQIAVLHQPQVHGFPVALQEANSGCSEAGGLATANTLTSNQQILGVVGHTCSSSSVSASSVYAAAHVPMISPSSTSLRLTQPGYLTTNRVVWNDASQARDAVPFLTDDLNVSQIALIHDDSVYGSSLGDELANAFTAVGGNIVLREQIESGDDDFGDLLAQVGAAGPELIYFAGYPLEAGLLAAQRVDAGLGDIPFFGPDGILSENFIAQAGAAAEGTYATSIVPQFGPGHSAFVDEFESQFGAPPAWPFSAHAYDATTILLDSIESVAGIDDSGNLTIDRQALAQRIRLTQNYPGVSGVIGFDHMGEGGTPALAVHRVQNSQWQEIWMNTASSSGVATPNVPLVLSLPEAGSSLTIPTGAVSSTVTTTLRSLAISPGLPSELMMTRQPLLIEVSTFPAKSITSFTAPVTLTLAYDDSDWRHAGVAHEASLNVFAWQDGEWHGMLPCAGCSMDLSANRAVVATRQPGLYAIMGEPWRIYLPLQHIHPE